MEFLLTGFQLLLAVLAGIAWSRAARAFDGAAHEARRLQEARGRVVANEHAIEALSLSVRKLTGRFNATQHKLRAAGPVDDDATRDDGAALVDDSEFAAEIALQNAPSKAPGSK